MELLVFLLAIGAPAMGHMMHMGEHLDHGCHMSPARPSYLKNVTLKAREEYVTILKHKNSTIAQQNEEIMKWAEKYDVKEQLEEYKENMTRIKHELKRNFTKLIVDLPSILEDFFNVTDYESQTRAEMRAALGKLKAQNPTAFSVLRFTFAQLNPRYHCPLTGHWHAPHGMSQVMPSMIQEEMKEMISNMSSHHDETKQSEDDGAGTIPGRDELGSSSSSEEDKKSEQK
ncbi:hypothetical protein COOONC_27303 [Cooperia oncophora]